MFDDRMIESFYQDIEKNQKNRKMFSKALPIGVGASSAVLAYSLSQRKSNVSVFFYEKNLWTYPFFIVFI